MDIYVGNKNSVEAMTQKLGTIKATVNDADPATKTMAFKRLSVALPVYDKDVTRCVGINLVTPLLLSGYLQINGIYVGEKGQFGAVTDIAADASDASIAINGNMLTIFGHFNNAVLYNLQGIAVAKANSAMIDLGALEAGVYILNVDGKSFKIAR